MIRGHLLVTPGHLREGEGQTPIDRNYNYISKHEIYLRHNKTGFKKYIF